MEPRFCFTLDTEPDDLWADAQTQNFEHFRVLPQFHRRLIDAGAKPTYLTTSEVVQSKLGRQAMEACLVDGHCEVGAHFHSWTRDWPFEVPDLGSPRVHAMAHQLGQPIEQQMLEFTCRVLHKALGVEPRSHRGGRWSLGPETARSLAKCGIMVDSTVTPGLSWRDARSPLLNGPDFRSASPQPFWLSDGHDGKQEDGPSVGSVLEIPVGAAFFPDWARKVFRTRFQVNAASKLGRTIGIRIAHRWLRPTKFSVSDMRAVMIAMQRARVPAWVFMIHSSEIIPCTPLPTKEAVEAFCDRCVGGIRAAIELGAKPATLKEVAEWVISQDLALSSSQTRSIFPE